MYDRYGFQRRALGSSKKEALTKYPTEDGVAKEADLEEFSMLPRIAYWDDQRRARLEKAVVSAPKDKVLLVSASSPKPCDGAVGDQMLLRYSTVQYSTLLCSTVRA